MKPLSKFLVLFLLILNMPFLRSQELAPPDNPLNIGFNFSLQTSVGAARISKKTIDKNGDNVKSKWAIPGGLTIRATLGVQLTERFFFTPGSLGVIDSERTGTYSGLYHIGFGLSKGRGALGYSGASNAGRQFKFELINSFHMMIGSTDGDYKRDFQFFTSDHASALNITQTQFLAIGTTFVLMQSSKKDQRTPVRVQRSGTLAYGHKNFTLFYTNDGGFLIGPLRLGDGWDRYWNGGLSLYWFQESERAPNELRRYSHSYNLNFNRYTGYAQNSYRIARQLRIDQVDYGDEMGYNKGQWKLSLRNHHSGSIVSAAITDADRLDLQNWMHKWGSLPWHPTFFPAGVQMGWGFNSLIKEQ